MLLSIVIPHYNIPTELLKQCIDSIIAQGIPAEDHEVIVVDDGSAVPPTWICDTYKGHNVRLFVNDHGGPGAARNRGIEEARGKYIQFVDADDYLLTNGQMEQCLAALKEEWPQILRFGYIVTKDRKSPRIGRTKRVKFSNTISGAMHMRDNNLSGSPCTYFFLKRLAIESGTTFSTNIFHEDEEFNTKLHYHAQTLIESNATLYCYCTREGSTTANRSKDFEARRIDNIFTIIKKINAFKEENAASANTIQRDAITRKLRTLTVDAILNMMYDGRKPKEIYDTCMEHLAPIGLFPLPQAHYSHKYKIFRTLVNTRGGMRVLRLIIPSRKPQKR